MSIIACSTGRARRPLLEDRYKVAVEIDVDGYATGEIDSKYLKLVGGRHA